MNDPFVTITGNVATEPRHLITDAGVHITSFRLAANKRKYAARQGWVDGPTSYVTVTCWRFLAQNVAAAISKGDPVVVAGALRVREWENGDRSGSTTEIDAHFVGHDLNRGVTEFRRVTRTRPVSPEEDEALRSMADEEGGGRFDEQFDEQEPAAEPAAEQAA